MEERWRERKWRGRERIGREETDGIEIKKNEKSMNRKKVTNELNIFLNKYKMYNTHRKRSRQLACKDLHE